MHLAELLCAAWLLHCASARSADFMWYTDPNSDTMYRNSGPDTIAFPYLPSQRDTRSYSAQSPGQSVDDNNEIPIVRRLGVHEASPPRRTYAEVVKGTRNDGQSSHLTRRDGTDDRRGGTITQSAQKLIWVVPDSHGNIPERTVPQSQGRIPERRVVQSQRDSTLTRRIDSSVDPQEEVPFDDYWLEDDLKDRLETAQQENSLIATTNTKPATDNFARPTQNGNRPSQNGGGSSQNGERPPQNGGRPTQNGGSSSQNGGNRPSQNGGSSSQNSGRPSQNGGSSSQNGGNRPTQNGERPTQNGGRPTQNGGSSSQNGGNRPSQKGGSSSQNGGSSSQNSGNRPSQNGGSSSQNGVVTPPQNALSAFDNGASLSQDGGSASQNGGPSRCVWAIVTCCKPQLADQPDIRYSCFEAVGCDGAFWDAHPCSRDMMLAALQATTNFYKNPLK